VVEISSVRVKWWCKEGGVYVEITGSEMCGEQGRFTHRNHKAQEGSLEMNGYNFSSDETSVGMYKLKEVMKKIL
jgi:hypothetical protein